MGFQSRFRPTHSQMSHVPDFRGTCWPHRNSPCTDRPTPSSDPFDPIGEKICPITDQIAPSPHKKDPFTDHFSPITDQRSPASDKFDAASDQFAPISEKRSGPPPLRKWGGDRNHQVWFPGGTRGIGDLDPPFSATSDSSCSTLAVSMISIIPEKQRSSSLTVFGLGDFY